MNIRQSFEDTLDTVIALLPKLVGFLLILIIGYIIAKILQKVVNGVLEKVGFDNAVERGGVKKALEKSRN
ncbi:MAG: hypothetical protein WKF47_18800 [Geodermatophilaceae bacterium]